MSKTIQYIDVHNLPDKWLELLADILGQIYSNVYLGQALWVHNAQTELRKLFNKYNYKCFLLLLTLEIIPSNQNQHSLEVALMINQVLNILWSSTHFYLTGGQGDIIEGDRYKSASSPSASALTYTPVLQPWFDVLTSALANTLMYNEMGLDPMWQMMPVDERNVWPWWKSKKWSAQILSRLLSSYGIPSYAEDEVKKFSRELSANVAPYLLGPVCKNINLQPSGRFCTDQVIHLYLTFVDLGQWDQPPHAHPAHFAVPERSGIACPDWVLQDPSLNYRGTRVRGEALAYTTPYIT